MSQNESFPFPAWLTPRVRRSSVSAMGTGCQRRLLLSLEELEQRNLLSATGIVAAPLLDATPAALALSPQASYGPAVYTPAQVRAAYGFSSLPENGAGQTIAIIAAYDDPYIASDLATFDRTFGLPGQTAAGVSQFFSKVNEFGQSANYPVANALWDTEIALDVEWAHAIAPGANILLVEANTNGGIDLLTALNTARNTPGVSVVSMSWATTEFNGEQYYNGYFTTPAGHLGGNDQPGGITFVAAAGDSGAYYGADWPAVSPNVLAVGGSSLTVYGYTYAGETAWSWGGGGYSKYLARPSYQAGVQFSTYRTTPDVAYNADPYSGVYVYSTITPYTGYSGWLAAGGTSAGTPQWAGLIALADQARAWYGRPSLNGAQSALYSLPSSDFHDITTGSNGYAAGPGYDLATGLGSPSANLVVPGLLLVPGDPGYGSSITVSAVSGLKAGGQLVEEAESSASSSAEMDASLVGELGPTESGSGAGRPAENSATQPTPPVNVSQASGLSGNQVRSGAVNQNATSPATGRRADRRWAGTDQAEGQENEEVFGVG